LSGRYALLGKQVLAGVRLFVEDLNRTGGFLLDGNRHTLELIVEDDGSSISRVREKVAGLITQHRVDVLLGPYGSGLTLAAAHTAEHYKHVLWNHSGSADYIFARGLRWQVGLLSPASTYMHGVLDALHARDPGNHRVALFSAETGFAAAVADGTAAWLDGAGIEQPEQVRYPTGMRDFRAQLAPLLAAPPDWIFGVGRIEDDIALARALCARGVGCRAMTLVVAGIDHFGAQMGPLAQGFLGPSQWQAEARYKVDCGPDARAFADAYRQRYGDAPDYPAAQGYVGGLVALRAVERAGTFAQGAVRAAAERLRCTTLYGEFAIEPSSGLQTGHHMLVTQWQHGMRRIVWPREAAEAELLYPLSPVQSF